MKLAIGTITSNDFPVPNVFWDAFITLIRRLEGGEVNKALPAHLRIDAFTWIRSQRFPTDTARNEICAGALTADCDYLLFFDCDMVHPADLVERLLFIEQPVVTARYHIKKPPFVACAFMEDRIAPGAHVYRTVHFGRGVFEIHACGAGALLIRRDVLVAIEAARGHNWFRYQRAIEPPHDFTISEDMWFCEQARALGFSIWCDWDLRCGHVAQQVIDAHWNDSYLLKQTQAMLEQPPAERALVAKRTIVRGIPEGIDYPSGEHVAEYAITGGER
jgi:hypothetical protein